jgi:CheY-like chemotaxis protein
MCPFQFSNAIKFTGDGKKIEVRVTRKTSACGKELVLIACKDEGAGLSKAHLKLLFGEGVQFHANKLQAGGGSGLGLFITKGIVTLHEGANIWAESEGEGKGCTFFVELPLVSIPHSIESESESDGDSIRDSSSVGDEQQDDANDQHSKRSGVGEMVQVRHNSKVPGPLAIVAPFRPRVLIVDDSLMNRRMLARMLEAEGFECVQAVDGLAAVAVVNRAVMHRRSSQPSEVSVPSRRVSRAVLFMGCHPSETADVHSNSRRPSAINDISAMSTPRTKESPDVILMDSNMPKMNGPDAVVEIRKMGFKFPIFGVTGDEDHAGFFRAGVDAVMMKPVRAAELVKNIKVALRKTLVDAERQRTSGKSVHPNHASVGLLAPRCATPVPEGADEERCANIELWLEALASPRK